MKTRFIILTVFIALCLMLAISAQTNKKVNSKRAIAKKELPSSIGKPVFESKEDSIITKVWIISQKKIKETMKTSAGGNMYKMKDNSLVIEQHNLNTRLNNSFSFQNIFRNA